MSILEEAKAFLKSCPHNMHSRHIIEGLVAELERRIGEEEQ